MRSVSYYIAGDLLRNRVIIAYTLLLAVTGWGTFLIESQPEKAILILMQATLLVLPLIAMVFATIYYYNSQDFISLLLAQPIGRSTVMKSFYLGLNTSLILGFWIGIGVPLLIFYPSADSMILMLSGTLLLMVFTAIALFTATMFRDKARGMGATLLLWVFFVFIFDGLLLFLMYQFADYPIEKAMLIASFFNPIDIARILIIIKTEASALMGLSGALFTKFFGTSLGVGVSFTVLLIWVFIPFLLAWRKFLKMDL
jgi:Cu-processing system permease protein